MLGTKYCTHLNFVAMTVNKKKEREHTAPIDPSNKNCIRLASLNIRKGRKNIK